MRKVLICIPTLAFAGAERFVTELACNIDATKFAVKVVVTNRLDKESAFYTKLLEKNITVIDVSNKNYFMECGNLVRLFRTEKPDIIHSNVGAILHVLLPQLLYHGKARHLFTAHSMGYRLFSGVKKRIVEFCFKHGIIIPVAICDTVKESIIESYGLSSGSVEVVYNGVDTGLFSFQSDKNEKEITFVSVGTLYHIKNHELLINAFYEASKKCANLRLVLVGDGELRELLQQQVERLGIVDKVFFAGNQRDVKKFLNMGDVYCCSSKVEGLPLSVLEAMACGLPVISTAAGGVVDIVKNGTNGFIVGQDATEYSEKMIELAQNQNMRIEMSKKSRELAKKYSIENCVRGYEQLYCKYSFEK